MKLIGFVCALALAGAVGGCGGDEENGTGGTGGTGATGGTGGAGGGTGGGGGSAVVTDACTNAADTAVYEGVTYTDAESMELTGVEAVSAIASDCVFGTAPNLTSDGCGTEVGIALGNNTPETRAALSACVVQCVIDQPVGLSADCLSCYGESVTLGAAFCAGPCSGGTDLPGCIDCRCGNNMMGVNIFDRFDECSGLPREVDECATN